MDLIREACKILKLVLQARAPYHTGNLAINSIRVVENKVLIGGEIADYAVFTNEPWTNRKGKNPNEGWVQAAIAEAAPLIQRTLGGRATLQEVQQSKKVYKDIINERKKVMVENLKQTRDKIIGAEK